MEILRSPSLFLDYLSRRVALHQRAIHTSDELDLLGYYLHHQLRFRDDQDAIFVHQFSEEIDVYFQARESGVAVPRPRPRFPDSVLALIATLEKRRCANFLDATLFLLADPFAIREKLDEAAADLTKRAQTGWVTAALTSTRHCLVLQLCSGRPDVVRLQRDVDAAAAEAREKSVLGIARSVTLPDGVRVCLPSPTATP